ncbi:MAG: hypothetical protein JST59_06740 [Actinobacteria bacterium]|nr:hypothetical protein [Actinomycetota bacterium]
MNVLYTDVGAIQQRPGHGVLSEPLTSRAESLEAFYTTGGARQILAGCGTRLEALEASGTVRGSMSGLSEGVWDFTRYGTPGAEVAYAGNGYDTIRKWTGSEWKVPQATVNGAGSKAMPKAGALCIWPSAGNRMVATRFLGSGGGPGGATSSPSHVWFSDPGNPESWHTTEPEENDVQLSPGDGEAIQAAVTWNEFVFVFKETSFFVFTGQGTDSGGSPEFVYRPVQAGVGMVSPRAVCVLPSGVYFMSRKGLYRTTGQEPQLVSGLVDPLWNGETSSFFTGGAISHTEITNCTMASWENRIYLSYSTSLDNDRVLVYDPANEWWSLYDLPASCMTSFRVDDREELIFGYSVGNKVIARHGHQFTNDAGQPIKSYWRSGWFDLGSPDVKTIRASKAWGTGAVQVALGFDFHAGKGDFDTFDFTDSDVPVWNKDEWNKTIWAEPKALVASYRRRAVRGTTFSLYLANSVLDQEWSLHRIDHLLREIAKPSKVTTT